jgi:hypothetical protein
MHRTITRDMNVERRDLRFAEAQPAAQSGLCAFVADIIQKIDDVRAWKGDVPSAYTVHFERVEIDMARGLLAAAGYKREGR